MVTELARETLTVLPGRFRQGTGNIGYMSKLGENIGRRIRELDTTQTDVAKAAGCSHVLISKLISGKNQTSGKVADIARALGLTTEELLSGEWASPLPMGAEDLHLDEDHWFPGDYPSQEGGVDQLAKVVEGMKAHKAKVGPLYRGITEDRFVGIPVRKNVELSAGSGFYVDNEEEVEIVPVLASTLRELGVHQGSAEVVRVKGDSMEPTLCEGDQVLVNTAATRPQNDKLYAFFFDEDTRVKRFSRKLDGTWRIISDNEDKNQYPDEVLANHNMDSIGIIGEVVAIVFRKMQGLL